MPTIQQLGQSGWEVLGEYVQELLVFFWKKLKEQVELAMTWLKLDLLGRSPVLLKRAEETVRKAFIIRLGSCTSMTWRYCIQPLLPERTQAKLIPCGPKVQSADVGSIVAPRNCFKTSPPTLMRLKGMVVSCCISSGCIPSGIRK